MCPPQGNNYWLIPVVIKYIYIPKIMCTHQGLLMSTPGFQPPHKSKPILGVWNNYYEAFRYFLSRVVFFFFFVVYFLKDNQRLPKWNRPWLLRRAFRKLTHLTILCKTTYSSSNTIRKGGSSVYSPTTVEAQQTSFNSLPRTVMDNHTLLFPLGRPGGSLYLVNTSCRSSIETTGQMEQFLTRLKEKATWL